MLPNKRGVPSSCVDGWHRAQTHGHTSDCFCKGWCQEQWHPHLLIWRKELHL
jgi:hypothetical protein